MVTAYAKLNVRFMNTAPGAVFINLALILYLKVYVCGIKHALTLVYVQKIHFLFIIATLIKVST